MRYDCDLAVIGAGPGGYVAAIYGAKNGLSTILIEKDETLGGTCLNRGCIPMKTLIHSATLWQELKGCGEFGIRTEGARFDLAAMQRKKEEVVRDLTGGVAQLMKANRIGVLRGTAKVEAAHTISLGGKGGERLLTARNILIATGSRSIRVPVPGAELPEVMDSDGALALTRLPKSLVVIGGGVIGTEIAYFYNALGVEVTIVEALPRLVDRSDEMVCQGLEKAFREGGIVIHTNSRVTSIRQVAGGVKVCFESPEGAMEAVGEKVLMAVGRSPALNVAEGLLKLKRGFMEVNDRMETGVEGLYAIGDITGKSMLAHAASHQGMTAVDNILGINSVMRYDCVPNCIYTNPEAAGVGLTEQEARLRHGGVTCGIFPFSAIGKARTMGRSDGFVKLVAEERSGRIVGAHILGPGATELIAELTLAVRIGVTAEELAHTVHAHPTLSEASMEAALSILGMKIHLP